MIPLVLLQVGECGDEDWKGERLGFTKTRNVCLASLVVGIGSGGKGRSFMMVLHSVVLSSNKWKPLPWL